MAADPAVVQALSSTDIFSGLSKRALNRVAGQAQVVDHIDGKQITEQGGAGFGFHLILSGTARVEVKDQHRGDLGPGDYFGEISLIDGKPRSATVTATSPLKTVSIALWMFHPILEEEPGAAMALLLVMCGRARAAEALI